MAMIKICKVGTKEWVNKRNDRLGGSDASAALGLNPYKSQIKLFVEKVKKISDDLSQNKRVQSGTFYEDAVAQRFMDETGLKVRRHNFMVYSEEYPFMAASFDRIGKDKNGKRFILEIKTTSEYKLSEWREGIPFPALCQIYHYLIVSDYDYGYVCAQIGFADFVIHKVTRDKDFESMIIEKEKHFWTNYVEKNVLPPVDETESTKKALFELYPQSKYSDPVILPSKFNDMLEEREQLKHDILIMSNSVEKIENEIKAELGEEEYGTTENFTVKWKTTSNGKQRRLTIKTKEI